MQAKVQKVPVLSLDDCIKKALENKQLYDLYSSDKSVKTLSPDEKLNIGVALAESGFSGYIKVKDVAKILEAAYPNFEKEFFLEKCKSFNIPLDKQIKDVFVNNGETKIHRATSCSNLLESLNKKDKNNCGHKS